MGMTATVATGNSNNVLAYLKDNGTISLAYTSATNVTTEETVVTITLTKIADEGKVGFRSNLARCVRVLIDVSIEEALVYEVVSCIRVSGNS